MRSNQKLSTTMVTLVSTLHTHTHVLIEHPNILLMQSACFVNLYNVMLSHRLSVEIATVYYKSFEVEKFTVAELSFNSLENFHGWTVILHGQGKAYCTSYFTGKVSWY